jgi:hypothetical protein
MEKQPSAVNSLCCKQNSLAVITWWDASIPILYRLISSKSTKLATTLFVLVSPRPFFSEYHRCDGCGLVMKKHSDAGGRLCGCRFCDALAVFIVFVLLCFSFGTVILLLRLQRKGIVRRGEMRGQKHQSEFIR